MVCNEGRAEDPSEGVIEGKYDGRVEGRTDRDGAFELYGISEGKLLADGSPS